MSYFSRYWGEVSTLKNGLISVWEFNETSAGVVVDAHGSNDGTISGATVDQPSVSKGYNFDGTNDYLDMGDDDAFSFGDGAGNDSEFSWSAWINPDVVNVNKTIFSKAVLGGDYEFFFIIRGSSSKILVRLNSYDNTANYIEREGNTVLSTTGGWYHVTATYDGSKTAAGIHIYMNGANDDGSTNIVGTYLGLGNSTDAFRVADWFSANKFAGSMDQVVIWNKIVTQAEVTEVFNSGTGLKYGYFDSGLKTNLVSLWELDETSGTNVVDSHGSNDGTNTGTADINQQGIVSNLEKGYSFNGSSDYIDSISLDITGYSAISINVWMKADETSSVYRPVSILHSSLDDIRIVLSSGVLYYAIDDGTAYEASVAYTDTTSFHMATLTFDGSTILAYLDGSEVDSQGSVSFNFGTADGSTRIGGRAGTIASYFNGKIDQPAIWSKVLTPTEIQKIYNSGKGLDYNNW